MVFVTTQVVLFVFLSLSQWHIKVPQTFKFVTTAFNFIIVALFLKCNISVMCHSKTMEHKASEIQLSDFTYLYFHFYSHYIKVYIYFLLEFCTFGFILKKSATDFHFCLDYMISCVCLSHSHSIYAVLTCLWYSEIKHAHRSSLTNLSCKHTHTQLGLLRHCGSLIDKQSFVIALWASSRLVWVNELNCSPEHHCKNQKHCCNWSGRYSEYFILIII
jgi:hypothetical protein